MTKIETCSVKVMRSHDYCHFEIVLGTTEADTPEKVDELRKAAARLADKAVEQYKVAKEAQSREIGMRSKYHLKLALETPEGERSSSEKAIIKFHEDAAFAAKFHYDYEDDFDGHEWED